jgi:hypothetical protein
VHPESEPELIAASLSFQNVVAVNALERLARFPENQWPSLFAYTDPAGLTLYLLAAFEERGLAASLPGPVLEALVLRREKNRQRLKRTLELAAGLVDLLNAAGLHAAFLKGFTLQPEFVASAERRVQYDLDLYLSEKDALRAHRLLMERGYEQIGDRESSRSGHLTTLLQKTGWEWLGDFYDLEIPRAVELHYQLWNGEFECLPVEISPDPLKRICWRDFDGMSLPGLCPEDQVTNVVLHSMRHILHGDLRISHLYEIGYFLERHAEDHALWQGWSSQAHTSLQRLAAVVFAITSEIFGAPRGPRAEPLVEAWAQRFSSTLCQLETNSKYEVILHLALLRNWRDKALVLRRRLLPMRLPGLVDAVFVAESQLTLPRRALRFVRQTFFVMRRGWFHLRAIPRFAWAWAAWSASRTSVAKRSKRQRAR